MKKTSVKFEKKLSKYGGFQGGNSCWEGFPGEPDHYSLMSYVGTEKIVGRGGPKIVTEWGGKIWLQGGGQLMGQGGGRKGKLSKTMTKKLHFGQFFCNIFNVTRIFSKIF